MHEWDVHENESVYNNKKWSIKRTNKEPHGAALIHSSKRSQMKSKVVNIFILRRTSNNITQLRKPNKCLVGEELRKKGNLMERFLNF